MAFLVSSSVTELNSKELHDNKGMELSSWGFVALVDKCRRDAEEKCMFKSLSEIFEIKELECDFPNPRELRNFHISAEEEFIKLL
ncbi:unnamed protein product [Parnassius apollo]|uniref:(apollo) hypothetical protein n=1 Tax=Parnassius apollo TaxID=110799 RepID=A0A8S3Y083_PARAO|nr:unnamed protein product [Parnassius apollo]